MFRGVPRVPREMGKEYRMYKHECTERITPPEQSVSAAVERMGYRIAPHRLSAIAKTTAKVMALLTDDGICSYSAAEARLILQMADDLIAKGEAGL